MKIATYNVNGVNGRLPVLLRWLAESTPDIVCLQEYYHEDKGPFKNNDTIKRMLGHKYAHIAYGITLRKTQHWGLATFTKYPVVNKGYVFYEEGKTNFGIYTDLIYEGDTIRIYNVHLQSNHLRNEDYKFLEQPDSGSNEQIANNVRRLG